jgi:uncharacterized protein YegP (UPF0339 family)
MKNIFLLIAILIPAICFSQAKANVEIRYNKSAHNYRVVTLGKNGELLSVSETLKSKQKAIQNIIAQMKTFVDAFMPYGMQDNVNVLVQEKFPPFDKYFLYLNGTKSKVGL